MHQYPISQSAVARALATTLALVAATQASAITVTRQVSDIAPNFSIVLHQDQAARFTLDEMLLDTLDVPRIRLTADAPAELTTAPVMWHNLFMYTATSFEMPVSSLTGEYMPSGFTASRIQTEGGMTLQTEGWYTRADGRLVRNTAATGGTLQITNLAVDLENNVIVGDVLGSNGAGSRTGLTIWHIGSSDVTELEPSIHCIPSIPAHCLGTLQISATFTGLSLDNSARDFLGVSLGLTPFGKSYMTGMVNDWGTLVVGVPEPSTWLTMGLGLVGIWRTRQRCRATTQ